MLATGGERVDQVRQHLRVAATALAAVDMDALLQHPRLAEAACQAGDRRQPSEAGPRPLPPTKREALNCLVAFDHPRHRLTGSLARHVAR